MNIPNFILIGAQKSGTNALYTFLKSHPYIQMSNRKEPQFFIFGYNKPILKGTICLETSKFWNTRTNNLNDYKKEFYSGGNAKAVGEASPAYIHYENCAKNIFEFNPDMKIIAILRNPIERAFSNFRHIVYSGFEDTLSFERALELEEMRIEQNWWIEYHYKRKGLYGQHLKKYYEMFPKHRIKVILHDDLKNRPHLTLKNIFNFLEVDSNHSPVIRQYGVSKELPKNNYFNRQLQRLRSKNFDKKYPLIFRYLSTFQAIDQNPTYSKKIKNDLIQYFREDIKKLEVLIDRDLSIWLS